MVMALENLDKDCLVVDFGNLHVDRMVMGSGNLNNNHVMVALQNDPEIHIPLQNCSKTHMMEDFENLHMDEMMVFRNDIDGHMEIVLENILWDHTLGFPMVFDAFPLDAVVPIIAGIRHDALEEVLHAFEF
jgi:hypothetical protein